MFASKNRRSAPGRAEKKPQTESGMTDLCRLDRIALMELIVEQRRRIEELEEKLEEAEKLLDRRNIRLDVGGINRKEDLLQALKQVLEGLEDIVGRE